MMDIKNFLKGWGGGKQAGGRLNFFIHITILFYQCNDKNIYQQFYCCLRYIFYFYVLMCFSLRLKNDNFSARNLSSSTVFDLYG